MTNNKKRAITYCKYDVAKSSNNPEESTDENNVPAREAIENGTEQTSTSVVETPSPRGYSPQTIVPRKSGKDRRGKQEGTEARDGNAGPEVWAHKGQSSVAKRVEKRKTSRKRVPTKRYGIDEVLKV